ncbi:probable oxidoreductase PXDNL [Dreissena polymorpha]|uniref:probable oxidoreductase PXDNL n=1 Tax=Dreissena polymorpha TaxID=45954 RepID=UPI0022655DCC|nr:probable oxidoreductase PXDNL [Dreissena polymorpha]
MILSLWTGVSRGQCPEKCYCDGHRVRCRGQQLSTIPLSLSNATILDLSMSMLESLPEDAFKGWPNLTGLDLSSNRLRNISRATFRGLAKLRWLYLTSNTLEYIDDGAFEGMSDLEQLNLHDNRLRNISRETFIGLAKLRILYLRNNRIRNISRPAFRDLTHLKEIYLSNNLLICDCQLRWLIETVQDSQSKLKVYGAVCSEPAHLKGRNIVNVIQSDLNCTQENRDFPAFRLLTASCTSAFIMDGLSSSASTL